MLIILILMIIVLIVLLASIRVVPATLAYVISSYGIYKKTWHAGLHFKIPFVEKVIAKLPLTRQAIEDNIGDIITKDNKTVKIKVNICYYIVNPKLYCYGVNDPENNLRNLVNTATRQIVTEKEYDYSVFSRGHINLEIQEQLNEAIKHWGINICELEFKEI